MSKEDSDLWRIRVDTGGTFTDCWALAPGNTVPRYLKVLSSGELRLSCPEDTLEIPRSWELSESFFRGWSRRRIGRESVSLSTGETAPQIGMRILTQTPLGDAFPPIDLRLATTRGTNALLEGKGAATVLLVTRGFADLLLIGDQRRPDLFSLSQNLPSPIPVSTIEVEGRLDAAGHPLSPLSLSQESRRRLSDLVSQGVRHAAVALLHSYRNPTHEKELEEILQTLGFDHVSLSSELAPLIKILPRTETAVVDSTLTPVLGEFLDQVQSSGADLKVMTSSGSLLPRRAFRPKDSLFSGPAGGVVGAAAIGRRWGRQSLIAFDMGGT
ncbi:MAG: hydantoinase/oxoprolinase N-terminal domain-containing protein, partial [Verrucomicrobiota bacterium]